jgi:hypothetical protein
MTTTTRHILLLTKARLRNDITAIEQALGTVAARTVTLPLVAAFDAINRILTPPKYRQLAGALVELDNGSIFVLGQPLNPGLPLESASPQQRLTSLEGKGVLGTAGALESRK